jgi:hypothetical protein
MILSIVRLISFLRTTCRLRSDLSLENLTLRQRLAILKRRQKPGTLHGFASRGGRIPGQSPAEPGSVASFPGLNMIKPAIAD